MVRGSVLHFEIDNGVNGLNVMPTCLVANPDEPSFIPRLVYVHYDLYDFS